MATKKKKSKPKPKSKTNPIARLIAAEKKIERLELLSQAQDLEHITTRINALKIKLHSLQTEANMIGKETGELQKDGQTLADEFAFALTEFKEKYNVPADKEVNLRTGELVDPPPQQGAPGQQGGPLPGPPADSEPETP